MPQTILLKDAASLAAGAIIESARQAEPTSGAVAELEIDFRGRGLKSLATNDLARLLEAFGGTLQILKLVDVALRGDFDRFCESLLLCKKLQTLYCDWQQAQQATLEDMACMGRSLAQLPELTRFDLQAGFHQIFHMLMPALQSPTCVLRRISVCEHLTIADALVQDRQEKGLVELLLSAVAKCNSLKKLKPLGVFGVTPKELLAVGNLIRDSSLVFLLVAFRPHRTAPREDICFKGLAEALKSNNSLKTLAIGVPSRRSSTAKAEMQAFSAALKDHHFKLRTLDFLKLVALPKGFVHWHEFDDTLIEQRREIQFYLSLNRHNRTLGRAGIFLNQAGQSLNNLELVSAIASKNDDISFIFHFLRNTSNICTLVSPPKEYSNVCASDFKKEGMVTKSAANEPSGVTDEEPCSPPGKKTRVQL